MNVTRTTIRMTPWMAKLHCKHVVLWPREGDPPVAGEMIRCKTCRKDQLALYVSRRGL